MSGQLQPLIAADQAGKLLDELVLDRVLGCIDLQALFMVEVDLWVALSECGVANDEDAKLVAKSIIDRALRRVPDDGRRYPSRPFGMDCDLCDDEVRETVKKRARPKG